MGEGNSREGRTEGLSRLLFYMSEPQKYLKLLWLSHSFVAGHITVMVLGKPVWKNRDLGLMV